MKFRQQMGFTLIELLVALVILGMLVGLVGPQFFGKVDSSKAKTAQIQVDMLKVALQTYRLDMGSYPDQLEALWRRPEKANAYWSGPYTDGRVPLDPWERAYKYGLNKDTEHGFVLYSLGADGVDGGEGLNADIGYLLLDSMVGRREQLE